MVAQTKQFEKSKNNKENKENKLVNAAHANHFSYKGAIEHISNYFQAPIVKESLFWNEYHQLSSNRTSIYSLVSISNA